MMAHDTAHDTDFYGKLVGLGWPGLLVPEEYGGTAGTFLDITVIMEEAGKALVPGPFFATAADKGLDPGGRHGSAEERTPPQAGRGRPPGHGSNR